MQFNSVQYIAHPVQCLSILLFFPIEILVSQIVSSCKFFFWQISVNIFHISSWKTTCTALSSLLILPCHLAKEIKFWSLCDFFFFILVTSSPVSPYFYFSWRYNPLQVYFSQSLGGSSPLCAITRITNDIRFTSPKQHNLLFSIRSSKWQYVSTFYSNEAIIRSSKDNL